jgi:hypothetical protein
VKHGVWSPRRVQPLASGLHARLMAEVAVPNSPTPWLAEVTFQPPVWAWARTEARIQLVSEWLMDRGSEVDDKGEALGAANLLSKLERAAESLRSRLGLDPLSRARLGRDVTAGAVHIAQLMAEAGSAES